MSLDSEHTSESSPSLPSVEIFARNVTDRDGLGFHLINVARAELGPEASADTVEKRATKLLLDALLHVGISPRTEQIRREWLFGLLRGDALPANEIQKCVEYVLSQMVIQSKGALAEVLAILPCLEHLQALQSAKKLPPNAQLGRGVWSQRLEGQLPDGSPNWAEWREAADGLFYCHPTAEQRARARVPRDAPALADDDLVILGVAEVKCFTKIARWKLESQIDAHMARVAGGLQFRSPNGEQILRAFLPNQLWYATWNGECLDALPAASCPFRVSVVRRISQRPTLTVSWTHALMNELIRLRIGPRSQSVKVLRPIQRRTFDANIPFTDADLEDMGVAMAYYTLGAMADEPEVDLPGAEWRWNVERALQAGIGGTLSPRQRARREKILRRLQ